MEKQIEELTGEAALGQSLESFQCLSASANGLALSLPCASFCFIQDSLNVIF